MGNQTADTKKQAYKDVYIERSLEETGNKETSYNQHQGTNHNHADS